MKTSQAAQGDSQDLFIDTKLSSETPYVGQRIVYTWRFYRSVRLADANVDLPDFEGFIVEELGDQREFNTTLNGKSYVVTELLRALTPQEAGPIELPGSSLNADVVVSRSGRRRSIFDDMLGRAETRRMRIESTPHSIEVQELPRTRDGGIPIVGRYEVAANVSPRTLKTGGSTTVDIALRGYGNWKAIQLPTFAWPASLKVYPEPRYLHGSLKRRNPWTKDFSLCGCPIGGRHHRAPRYLILYPGPRAGADPRNKTYTRPSQCGTRRKQRLRHSQAAVHRRRQHKRPA